MKNRTVFRAVLRWVAVVLVIMACAATAAADQVSPADDGGLRRFGIFVGANDGGHGRVVLAYAASDAKAVADVMLEMGGLSSRDLYLLSDPTPEELQSGFTGMRSAVADAKARYRRVEFVLYYSGHSDEQGILLGENLYPYEELRKNIVTMGADVNIAILDSCASGAITRIKGGSRGQPFLLDESVNTKGHAFITSSSEDEAAQESDSIGGSFFTHYLVSALRGAADSTRDGKVTLNEAYTYAFNETLTRTSTTLAGPQHASHEINLSGSGDLVLTDLRVASAGVVFEESVWGRMFVKDRSGRLVAEIRKESGVPLTLALPAGRYSVTLETSERLYSTQVALSSTAKTQIGQESFVEMSPEVARRRGGSEPDGGKLPQDSGAPSGARLPAVPPHVPVQLDGEIAEAAAELGKDVVSGLIHLKNLLLLIPRQPAEEERYVVHDFALKLVGKTHRIEGLDLGLMNFVGEDVMGVQIGGVGNFVGGDVDGVQASGLFNVAGGSAAFFQSAGLFNVNGGGFRGFQSSGLFNINGDDATGFIAAGLFNKNGGMMDGVQAAGLFNAVDSVRGVQAAPVNVAGGTARGVQLGVVNIGGTVRGVQVGVVNISKELHGVPIGLINISANGLFNPSAWTDDTGFTYAGFQMGAGWLYTLLYGGVPYDAAESIAAVGGGLGLHLTTGPLFFDMDMSLKGMGTGSTLGESFYNATAAFGVLQQTAAEGSWDSSALTVYPMARVTAGFTIFRSAAIMAGMSLEGHVPGVTSANAYAHAGDPWVLNGVAGGRNVELYPRWYVGFRL